ncbi:dihydroxy-acid dehydratase [Nitrobacter hamburgensis]|uniref:dihydroxy-acid dehydratase domain-containing protein n=1 Tax=Nitrobacter hamburgensis TaxID=912 RepID=UPI0000555048|nr:dihydroxy-acid dehydratase [Nitrobacter hamburgensis]
MDVETGIKSRLPNRHGTEGQERARDRAHLPGAAVGGPIGLLRDGDMVETDAVAGTLDVNLTAAERAERKTNWQLRATNHTSGVLWKYTQQIGPAVSGVLTYRGGVYEKLRYVDV